MIPCDNQDTVATQVLRLLSEGGFHDTACFLAQQAADKALKSLLYYLGARRTALLTHSLVEMVEEVQRKVVGVAALLQEARQLDLHYIPSRYPNGLPSGYPHQFYGKEMAQHAAAAAEKILGFVADYYRDRDESGTLAEGT